jgi:hypothetical protein
MTQNETMLLTYLYIEVGWQNTGRIHSSTNSRTGLLLLLWSQHSRATSCITCDGRCLVKLRHSTSIWIHCHYVFKVLIHTVQSEMVVLHVMGGLLLLLLVKMLGMVWMV